MDNRKQKMTDLRLAGFSLQTIADEFHITRERVRQIVGNTGRISNIKKQRLNRIILSHSDIELSGEHWLPVPGYEGLYSISDMGRLRNEYTNKIQGEGNGRLQAYKTSTLSKNKKTKTVLIHSLVASAFLGEKPQKYVINHKDGNKKNNFVENLEYVTHGDNTRHYHKNIKIPFYCSNCKKESNLASEKMKYCPYCGELLHAK